MNEEQKNIETCLPEDVLSEVANVPTDPQFRSLVEESFDPLQQQALQQAGYDGYKEVVMYHQPYTFTSQVKQMKSNLILLLRRLWRFPFGRGTTASSDAGSSAASSAGSASASAAAPIRSLADMWQHYITRLKGNPEYGIPSRLSSLTDLPDAPSLLSDRKIGGVPEAADGISLVHLLNIAHTIETLTDNTEGWTMVRNNLGMFTGLKHLQLGCDVIDETPESNSNFIGTSNYEDLDLSKVKKVYIRNNSGCVYAPNAVVNLSGIEEFYGYTNHHRNGYALISACANESLDFSKLHKIESTGSAVGSGMAVPIVANSSALKNIDLSSMAAFNTDQQIANANKTYYFRNCPNVESIKVGKLTSFNSINFMCYGDDNTTMQKLVHFEIGAGTAISLNLAYWNPTTSLANNLQQFLSNFKTYIAERLTDNGTGLTLTLSQEVRNAIHAAEDEYGIENIIITQKGWTISPAPN